MEHTNALATWIVVLAILLVVALMCWYVSNQNVNDLRRALLMRRELINANGEPKALRRYDVYMFDNDVPLQLTATGYEHEVIAARSYVLKFYAQDGSTAALFQPSCVSHVIGLGEIKTEEEEPA